MIKESPSIGRLGVMVAFTLSCFGLLLFLWLSFGGPVPLKPEGYRVEASFREANMLVEEAEVRIAGLKVGRVKAKRADVKNNAPIGEMEIDHEFAPILEDALGIGDLLADTKLCPPS